MPLRRACLALLVCCSSSLAADSPSLTTLAGKKVTGDLVKLDDKEIVLKTPAGDVATPLDQVLGVDLQPAANLPRDAKYADVELTDGTLLHCDKIAVKGKQVELTLFGSDIKPVKIPLDAVSYVLYDAHDEKNVADWKQRFLSDKGNTDSLAIKNPRGSAARLRGTFGAGNDEGTQIQFDLNSRGSPQFVNLEKVHGMLFQRPAAVAGAPVICKAYDTSRNLLMVASASYGDAGFTITTPSGAKIEYPAKFVQRLDFSKGKLTFLSDLEPSRKTETSTEDFVVPFRRDVNLDNQKIRLRIKETGGETRVREFAKGLSLHSYTELEYELKGEYNEFKAVLGVEESVGGSDGPVIVKVEGDGRELFSTTITRKDEPKTVAFSVKDVQRLKIIVRSGDLLDLGKHVTLADARVSK